MNERFSLLEHPADYPPRRWQYTALFNAVLAAMGMLFYSIWW